MKIKNNKTGLCIWSICPPPPPIEVLDQDLIIYVPRYVCICGNIFQGRMYYMIATTAKCALTIFIILNCVIYYIILHYHIRIYIQ